MSLHSLVLASIILASPQDVPPTAPPVPAAPGVPVVPVVPAAAAPTPITTWLVAGPIEFETPALADAKTTCDDLLAADGFDRLRLDPQPGDRFRALDSAADPIEWILREQALFGSGEKPRLALAFTQIRTDRYVEAKLEIATFHRCRVWLDGTQVAEKAKAESKDAKEPGKLNADLSLETGYHRLLVATVFDPTGMDDWGIAATLEKKPDFAAAALTTDFLPRRSLAVDDLLDAATIGNVAVSPRGDLVAVFLRRPEVPADFSKRWVEIRDAKDLSLVFTSESIGDFSDLQWLPDGSAFSYITRDGEKGTIWRRDPDGGGAQRVLRDVDKLGDHRWLPDGRAVLYTVTTEEKPDDRGVKHMRSLVDRRPGQRNVGHLWIAVADGTGMRRKLVGGELSIGVSDVRQDGKALLFLRTDTKAKERPYSLTELHELDLTTGVATKLLDSKSIGGAAYSPDGERIYVLGGAVNLGAAAATEAGPGIPNDYQTLLLAFDRKTRALTPVVPGLKAAVEQLAIPPKSNHAYLRLEDGLSVNLARIDLQSGTLERLPAPFEVGTAMSVSDDGRRLVACGTGLATPQRLVSIDPSSPGSGGPVTVPEEERFDRITLGATETFDVDLGGDTIPGYVHLPVGFDSAKKYPAIVFYYGGTSPIPRDFGGRYPRDLWAANGYVCYSLTPSGTTGRGGAIAARHVNDWGDRTCEEILACLDRFLATHPYVDPQRVGCIGASYGGFMTFSLLTKTDRFKAAVSHAGISMLGSYWGEGFWGFEYSAVATAEKFPWNAPEIYVDKSPLFHADKITTPLLLSHGESDTNVPLGESEQMYTALTLLGKDVEFLKFAGQDHHILTYPVRKLWMKSILAWFDWKLKDQPGAWKKLYPK